MAKRLETFRLTPKAERDLAHWRRANKAYVEKIDRLIGAIMTSPFEGIGKPEQLVGILEGHWSRRISGKDRLVYYVTGSELVITQLRHHY